MQLGLFGHVCKSRVFIRRCCVSSFLLYLRLSHLGDF